MIEIEFDGRRLYAALLGLENAVENMRPAFLDIGEEIVASTKKRFSTKIAPDGSPWARNSPVTIARKGVDDPLIGSTGQLKKQINAHATNDEVTISSTMEYAAMQQFGGSKSEFQNLWGNIPARPFLGISNEDETAILDIIREHLESSL